MLKFFDPSSFKMADSTNGQYLRGDDFEAIWEETEEVEEQCAVIVRNVS